MWGFVSGSGVVWNSSPHGKKNGDVPARSSRLDFYQTILGLGLVGSVVGFVIASQCEANTHPPQYKFSCTKTQSSRILGLTTETRCSEEWRGNKGAVWPSSWRRACCSPCGCGPLTSPVLQDILPIILHNGI